MRTTLAALTVATLVACGPQPDVSADSGPKSVRYTRTCDRVECTNADRVENFNGDPHRKRCVWECARLEGDAPQRVRISFGRWGGECWQEEIEREDAPGCGD